MAFDQGSEWADWPLLAGCYDLDVYFCDPHSPWQRGAIENYNGTSVTGSHAAPTSPASTPPMRTG